MGNRGVIATRNRDLAVYLHWNGGRDSVEGFLNYCNLKGYRAPETDSYGWARLCQVIGNFFGGTLSLGIELYKTADTNNGDNGTYIIENWKIVDRESFTGGEQKSHPLRDILIEINNSQPKAEQVTIEDIDKYLEEEGLG